MGHAWATPGPQSTRNDANRREPPPAQHPRSEAVFGRLARSADWAEKPPNRPLKPIAGVRIPSGLRIYPARLRRLRRRTDAGRASSAPWGPPTPWRPSPVVGLVLGVSPSNRRWSGLLRSMGAPTPWRPSPVVGLVLGVSPSNRRWSGLLHQWGSTPYRTTDPRSTHEPTSSDGGLSSWPHAPMANAIVSPRNMATKRFLAVDICETLLPMLR